MSGAVNYSVYDWQKSPSFTNAAYFQNHTKTKSLSCFSGKPTNVDGKELVEVKPFLVRDAITGRPIKGTNQILAQTVLKQMEQDDRELSQEISVLTFSECERHGLYLKKGSSSITLTTADLSEANGVEGKVYKAYRYFPESALQPGSLPRLKAIQYTNSLSAKINYLRKNLSLDQNSQERSEDKGKISFYEKMLSYAHMDKALGSVMFDKAYSKDERVRKVQEYIDKLPEAEKKKFQAEIMRVKIGKDGKKVDFSTAQGLVENFNFKNFIQTAEHEMEFIGAQRKKKEPLKFDATNTKAQSVYLAKWLAASELASKNPNVTFLTDRESIESVSKSLSKQIDKAFHENRHSEVFVIGNQASLQMKQELREFRQNERNAAANERLASSLARTNANPVHQEQGIEAGIDRSF